MVCGQIWTSFEKSIGTRLGKMKCFQSHWVLSEELILPKSPEGDEQDDEQIKKFYFSQIFIGYSQYKSDDDKNQKFV